MKTCQLCITLRRGSEQAYIPGVSGGAGGEGGFIGGGGGGGGIIGSWDSSGFFISLGVFFCPIKYQNTNPATITATINQNKVISASLN